MAYEYQTLPATGYIRLRTILRFLPVSKSTWWAKVKTGEYPQPVKLGKRTTAWKAEDIQNLLRQFSNPTAQSKSWKS